MRKSGQELFLIKRVVFPLVVGIIGLVPGLTKSEERSEDVAVETLDTIEVPGTVVIQKERTITFLVPEITGLGPLPQEKLIPRAVNRKISPTPGQHRIVRDRIADIRGVRSPVRPAKAERPPYPRIAREQGWEGVVVLRLDIKPNGTVGSAKTQQSSGFPILDDSALQAVQQWRFEPAKDGEFPIPVTVDLPIRFDLDQ